jgi:hypothetical protein
MVLVATDAAMVAILNNLVFEHVFCALPPVLHMHNVDATTVGTVVCGSHDECCRSLRNPRQYGGQMLRNKFMSFGVDPP